MKSGFNAAAQKIVDWDEYKAKKTAIEMKQFSLGDHLFEAFVDFPSKAFLWMRRGFGEAADQIRGRPAEASGYYYDTLNQSAHSTLYFDRDMLESDLAYFARHGISGKFQAKAAAISRQAFDECRDFSCLVEAGQLQKFSI
jgi:hypothetical protein